MKKNMLISLVLLLLLSGCFPVNINAPHTPERPTQQDATDTSDAIPSPTEPDPMRTPDKNNPSIPANGARNPVYLDEVSLVVRESHPPQIAIYISGNLPTPCHQLHVDIKPPDEQNRIFVDIFSTSDPDVICIQVLQPIDTNIDLGTFPRGRYSVWVNGEKIGEFDV